MIEVTTPPSPFTVGDLVLTQDSARPRKIVAITENGAHMVRRRGKPALPYGPHELEKVSE